MAMACYAAITMPNTKLEVSGNGCIVAFIGVIIAIKTFISF